MMKFIRTSNGLIEVRFYGLVGYVRDPFNNEFAPIGLILFIFFFFVAFHDIPPRLFRV